jgi:2-aminoadipate transaminase
LDSKEMLPRAVTELVAYTPGTAFYANGEGQRHLRLAFCYPTPEFITEGIKRLAKVITEEIELVSTFGPPASEIAQATNVDSSSPGVN